MDDRDDPPHRDPGATSRAQPPAAEGSDSDRAKLRGMAERCEWGEFEEDSEVARRQSRSARGPRPGPEKGDRPDADGEPEGGGER